MKTSATPGKPRVCLLLWNAGRRVSRDGISLLLAGMLGLSFPLAFLVSSADIKGVEMGSPGVFSPSTWAASSSSQTAQQRKSD